MEVWVGWPSVGPDWVAGGEQTARGTQVLVRCCSLASHSHAISDPCTACSQSAARWWWWGVLDGPRIVWKTILEHCQIVLPLNQPYPLTN